ncbi:hypothetical protein SDIAM103S_04533 [Streptomyces diastaticus subsp. diastaticus]
MRRGVRGPVRYTWSTDWCQELSETLGRGFPAERLAWAGCRVPWSSRPRPHGAAGRTVPSGRCCVAVFRACSRSSRVARDGRGRRSGPGCRSWGVEEPWSALPMPWDPRQGPRQVAGEWSGRCGSGRPSRMCVAEPFWTGATASRGGWCVEKRAGGKAAVLAGDPGALPVAGPCHGPGSGGAFADQGCRCTVADAAGPGGAVGGGCVRCAGPGGVAARFARPGAGLAGRRVGHACLWPAGKCGRRAWRVCAELHRGRGWYGWGPAARGPGPSSTPARAVAARRRRAGVPGEGCPRAAGCRRGGSHGCAARRRGSARPPSAGWSPSRPTGEGWGGGRATARRSKGSRTAPRRGPAV